MKKTLITISSALFAILFVTSATFAIGTLTPTGTPGDDTQYTLNDIYIRLTTNATATEGSGQFATPGSVAASFMTLKEIYEAIPTIDPTKLASGITYLGVTGTMQGAPAPLTWAPTASDNLCWDADSGCSAGSGLLDPNGDESLLLGAMEYCQYLNEDGTTLAQTPQNHWRLPTIQEFVAMADYSMSAPATQVPGFSSYDYYWSSTQFAGYSDYAWNWYSSDGSLNVDFKYSSNLTRCAR